MKGYSILILLLSCAGCMGQITLTVPGAVTEGAPIVVTCTVIPAVVVDTTFRLMYNTMSTTEDGFDHPLIGGYACTILAGQTVGTVSIPTIDDVHIDVPTAGEALLIDVLAADLGAYIAGAQLTVMINEGGTRTGVPINVVPRQTVYKGTEGAMVDIVLDFVDADGNPAPIEEDLLPTLSFPTSATDSAAAGAAMDFTDPSPVTLAYTTGMAETSATIQIMLNDDALVENLATFNVMLGGAAGLGSITAVGSPVFQVQIADTDKTELIVIHDNRTPLPRRSKNTVTAWAVTDETMTTSPTWDVSFTYLLHNLNDCRISNQLINSCWASKVTLPRPNRNTKSRFNEYTFSREQTFGDTTMHVRTARTFLEPTNHKQGSAPIESDTSSVLVVYPEDNPCTALKKPYTISIPSCKYNSQLRWGFIPEGGTKSDFKILKHKGNTLTLTECGKAGLYVIFRAGRGKKGWLKYIRVIQAACPCEMVVTSLVPPVTCGPAACTCKNGGTVDQALNLCCCPPGFAGKECELATEPGTFGSNCKFRISDYIKDNKRGKCITFSFPDVCGVTCAAGFGGADCCEPCKKGKFGANCAQTCHCVDDVCDTFSGACANGCLPGYSGFNCQ